MNFDLKGKHVWVTGASRGIGRQTAELFAKQGANVLVTATKLSNLNDLVSVAQTEGWALTPAELDFSKETWCTDIEAIFKEHPHPDVLINNAGMPCDGLLMRQSESVFNQALLVNLQGAVELVRRSLRSMLKKSFGRVINISSVVASTGNAGQAYYCAAKAGLEGFTRAVAREVGSRGITVNAIAPGLIETAMTEHLTEAQKERAMQEIPLGRVGKPSDIAALALFLASENGSYITGQVLHVNGGMFMGS